MNGIHYSICSCSTFRLRVEMLNIWRFTSCNSVFLPNLNVLQTANIVRRKMKATYILEGVEIFLNAYSYTALNDNQYAHITRRGQYSQRDDYLMRGSRVNTRKQQF